MTLFALVNFFGIDVAYGEASKTFFHHYLPFIIIIGALYTIAGGIKIDIHSPGTPLVNTTLLAFGTFLAGWIGTTGASMLLIRPLLFINAHRKTRVHQVVFFIFLIANVGGALTPLGDPPLFLGFLNGVDFFWTFNILPHMLVTAGLLLICYFFLDTYHYRREKPAAANPMEKVP